MSRRKRCAARLIALVCGAAAVSGQAPRRISEDRELTELDLSAWDCKDQPGGSAKTDDGVERNTGKNRPAIPVTGLDATKLDTAGFLRLVSGFDGQTRHMRRKDLTAAQKEQLSAIEKQPVWLTAYMVIVYAGPPESTNCASVDLHDWHLELFEKPLEHAPQIGDPTPIICEITPRTQTSVFRDGTRLQKLAGFFRTPDLQNETLGQKPQRVRITGYPLWDDEHNGAADIGTTIQKFAANGFHQPWRSTAWEIHPVLKIERADGSAMSAATPITMPAAATSPAAAPSVAPAASVPLATPAPTPPDVTIMHPVKVKIRYGETVLPRGMKLPLVSRDAQSATVGYMGQKVSVPLTSTDLN
ncbi:MAG: hypothetical protein ACR2ID_02600 [Chthoniobacterales bacterium]